MITGRGQRLIDRIVSTDLADLEPCLQRHHILLGTRTDTNTALFLKPYGVNVLLTGTSGGGKTTLATGIIERLIEQAYQVCIMDPEGDYAHLEDTIMLGSSTRSPAPEEVLQLLEKPQQSVVMNLLGIALEDRPAFFQRLLPRLQELRAQTGHPHWIVVDDTHHLLPAALESAALLVPQNMYGMMMLTVQPQHVTKDVLALADVIITIGEAPHETLRHFSEMLGLPPPWSQTLNRAMQYCGQGTRQLPQCSTAPCHPVSNASGMCANIWKVIWAKTRAFPSVARKGSSICVRRISWSSCSLPRVLTMQPGYIICIKEITSAGSAMSLKLRTWRKKRAKLASATRFPPERAVFLSKQLLRSVTRRQLDPYM
jgi:hypothetical protein